MYNICNQGALNGSVVCDAQLVLLEGLSYCSMRVGKSRRIAVDLTMSHVRYVQRCEAQHPKTTKPANE